MGVRSALNLGNEVLLRRAPKLGVDDEITNEGWSHAVAPVGLVNQIPAG